MTNSKEMLARIAALRSRLDNMYAETEDAPLPRAAPERRESRAPTPRLTFRAAQLLKDARAALAELKALADDPIVQREGSVAQNLHREAAGLLDVILRNLLAVPEGAAAQLRYCEGLQTGLAAVREKMHVLQTALAEERRENQRVDFLAALLRRLANDEPVDLSAFVDVARGIVDEGAQGAPLLFRASPQGDVARLTACHGLAVARVQASILRGEISERQRLAESLIPALVHDVGMLFVPADLIFKTSRLNDSDRAVIHQHPVLGQRAIRRLYPGGGWPVDAIADHHERLDGSGYPTGKATLALGEPARLLAACDVYAALASPRPHRPAADPRTALADTLMLIEQGLLDRSQTEKLLRLSFYPAGSVVQLSDGAIALVVGPPKSKTDPAKATVIPLRTPTGAAPPYPWPVDLTESSSLNILRALTPAERRQVLGQSHPSLV
jgi:hypothetical protein